MILHPGKRILSDIVFYRTYAATLDDGRKESVTETIERITAMHVRKYPQLEDKIRKAFEYVQALKVMPSMRSMQFGGEAIERSNARMFNCAYLPIESFKDIAEILWISMNGTGVGYSVKERHVSQLPIISGIKSPSKFIVEDSREGWAASMWSLLNNPLMEFDYSQVRKKGARLSTGGTASGPKSLRDMHTRVRAILMNKIGRKLSPMNVHEIICHMGDLVRCGGVRRTALISLFDADNEDMLTCKSGDWYEYLPHLARANNSACILRSDPLVTEKIRHVLTKCFESGAGEPGLFLTNGDDWGINPCAEVALEPRTFCNLTEVNVAACTSAKDFFLAVEAAAAIGTLQASYTDFAFLSDAWRNNCERDALLGVSLTGQAIAPHLMTPAILSMASSVAVGTNRKWAKLLGINPAARIGCTKPSGSTSAFLGVTSGIHAAHDKYYLRRVRVDTYNPIARYLVKVYGISDRGFIEKDIYSEDSIVVTLPIAEEPGTIIRGEEDAITLMDRAKNIYTNWIIPSHNKGDNTHSVSLTVTYKEEEKDNIIDWAIANKDIYAGISFLPHSGGSYTQMPFESITKEQYEVYLSQLPKDLPDFSKINFSKAIDERRGEAACAGGSCEIT